MFTIAIMTAAIITLALGSAILELRDATLANGTSMQYGSTSNGLQWQASGVLKQGCSLSSAHISNCYSMSLTSDATKQLDSGFPDSPRQRIEFLTKGAADGTSATYKWKYFLSSQTGTTTHFFHVMQVFSRGDNSPVITLDAVKGQVTVNDYFRNCSTNHCPTVSLAQFTDRTTQHALSVTFGPSGKLRYVVTNADTGATILSYMASGKMGSQSTSLKFGVYRAAVSGMTAASAYAGDFTSW